MTSSASCCSKVAGAPFTVTALTVRFGCRSRLNWVKPSSDSTVPFDHAP